MIARSEQKPDLTRLARFYTLTAQGRKQLAPGRQQFDRMVRAIQHVLQTT